MTALMAGILSMAAMLAAPAEEACRKLGTAIAWDASIESAAAAAAREGKLLLLLHVSGEFDDPALT